MEQHGIFRRYENCFAKNCSYYCEDPQKEAIVSTNSISDVDCCLQHTCGINTFISRIVKFEKIALKFLECFDGACQDPVCETDEEIVTVSTKTGDECCDVKKCGKLLIIWLQLIMCFITIYL